MSRRSMVSNPDGGESYRPSLPRRARRVGYVVALVVATALTLGTVDARPRNDFGKLSRASVEASRNFQEFSSGRSRYCYFCRVATAKVLEFRFITKLSWQMKLTSVFD